MAKVLELVDKPSERMTPSDHIYYNYSPENVLSSYAYVLVSRSQTTFFFYIGAGNIKERFGYARLAYVYRQGGVQFYVLIMIYL